MSKYNFKSFDAEFPDDAAKLAEVLPHPRKTLVSLDEARQWSAADYLVQRKYDGELATRRVGNAVLLGELVRAKSGAFLTAPDRARIDRHGSFFAAFTILSIDGANVLEFSTAHRWRALGELVPSFPPDVVLAEIVHNVTWAMAGGAEGVCAHAWGDAWGSMLCHKAGGIWTCRVTRIGNTQSVGIADAETGAARGNVKLGGGKCDRVRVGSVIRVEGMGLTDKGLIRQPVLCREWLVTL